MVERLVDYFYTLSYSENEDAGHALIPASEAATRQAGSFLVNAGMYTLGDVYDIPPLKELARKRFRAGLKTNWAFEDLIVPIVVVYTTTPDTDRGLRDCIKEIVQAHGNELFEKGELAVAVKMIGNFALDVVTAAYHCQKPSFRCSHGNCSNTDDSGLRVCQYHRHNHYSD